MPVQECKLEGRSGFRWGKKGKCYTYRDGDLRGKAAARLLAEAQGRAAIAAGAENAPS